MLRLVLQEGSPRRWTLQLHGADVMVDRSGVYVDVTEDEWMQLVNDYNRQCGHAQEWIVRKGMRWSKVDNAPLSVAKVGEGK